LLWKSGFLKGFGLGVVLLPPLDKNSLQTITRHAALSMLSFEQFIHGGSQKNVEKILELKLKFGGRPDGAKLGTISKISELYQNFYHLKWLLLFFG
jgi:hypothetical protein